MSGRGRRVYVRIVHTVAYSMRCPRLSGPEAMRAFKFTLDKSASRSKQMTIHRSFAKKATGGKLVLTLRELAHSPNVRRKARDACVEGAGFA
jgi:hypothetical protein